MPRKRKGQAVSAAPGQEYGARAAQEAGQSEAPLAQAEQPDFAALAQQMGGAPKLSAPGDATPVTSGMPIGPGPGPEAAPIPTPEDRFGAVQAASVLPMLYAYSQTHRLSPETVRWMRSIRANLPPNYKIRDSFPQDS